jgi:RimJ/RimL family protein N-acetyltransferase
VTREGRERWFEQAAGGDEALWFTIYALASWRPIGTTDLFARDERHRSAEFGMMIGEAEARGRGFGTETARLMLDYAITALGLRSVHLEVDEFNLAGRRAYAKAGFREVGRYREAIRLAGRWWDLILLDCLAHEFVSPVLGRVFSPDLPR